MTGINGLSLPVSILERLPALGTLFAADDMAAQDLIGGGIWVAALAFIALALPNSFEVTARYEPVIDRRELSDDRWSLGGTLRWSPTFKWAAVVSVLVFAAIVRVGGESEFLYWQF
jgi:hypothetical protein